MPLREHLEKTPCCFGDKTSHTDTARMPECRQTRIQPRMATSSASSPPVLPAPAETQVHGMPFFSSSSGTVAYILLPPCIHRSSHNFLVSHSPVSPAKTD